MSTKPRLWMVRVYATQDQFPVVEEIFADDASALSLLEAQEDRPALIEILFDREIAPETIKSRLEPIGADIRFEIEPVGDLDWIKKVCEHFEPLSIARWTIFGAAFKDQIKGPTLGLQIDATSAFGTGEHPTTRGCLLMLDRLLLRHPHATHWRMLDMGCGSGILAMAFAKATGARAIGVDMDELSVEIAQSNLQSNGLSHLIRIEHGVGYANPLIEQAAPFDLIMANIFADPLCEMAKDLKNNLKPGGTAILSGFFNRQALRVLIAHEQQGLRMSHRLRIGEWSVLALTRPMGQS